MKNVPLLLAVILFLSCQQTLPPEPFGATPSEQQLAWQELEYYAFVHFNINTFTDREWGQGTESPALFNPTQLDCRQWARIAKAAGMKGIIITAKHHDGFCLWDSKYTEHDVANSPWRNGQGDVLRDLAEACKEYGLKMGIYMSPWDRNNPLYGKPEYNEYFEKQLAEVLTGYGDIFEVWFDGAVSEEYKAKQIYDWDGFIATVRKYQPNAVIFSDAGPDVRWVGTEEGFANATNWSTLNRADYFPGTPRYLELRSGNKNGTDWVPAEVNTSIRPGWYYHPKEDTEVKSADHLELIYYNSIGRNGNFLLNLPVDRRGLVNEKDSAALMGLKARIEATFSTNLAAGQKAKADHVRGRQFAASKVLDGNRNTYWAAEDGQKSAALEIHLSKPERVNVVSLQEYIPLGQRVENFSVEAKLKGQWEEIGQGTTIGNKRLVRIPEVEASDFRINILSAMASPTISEVGLYWRPHKNYLLKSKKEFNDRMAWWRAAKFGMFIHWGAYSVPAGVYKGKKIKGIGEWIMNSAPVPVKEYEGYVHRFNPLKFNAEEWVRIAKNAGVKYIVITSKHHEGFALWDSKVSTYDIMDASPFKRDILKELRAACDKEGIKLGFYHSIMDWHHPDAQGPNYPTYNTQDQSNPNFARYRENYLKPQLRELVKNYSPAVLWFDGEWIPEWTEAQGKDLYQFVRSLKPGIIINNRVGKGRQGMQGMNKEGEFAGDFGTPEQEILERGSSTTDWESCMTMNNTWGYKKFDHNWKSAETLIHNLVDIAAKGGNYLLNVGPTSEGIIPQPSVARLAEMGDWMRVNGEAIYGAKMWKHYREGEAIRYTSNGAGTLYAISLDWPGEQLNLKFVQPKKDSEIHLLGYEKPLSWSLDAAKGLHIQLPKALQEEKNRPCKYAFVFKIETE